MATIGQSMPPLSRPLTWVRDFLKEELAPYPGRAALVARMTIAATLVMIVCNDLSRSVCFPGRNICADDFSPDLAGNRGIRSGDIACTAIGAAFPLVSMWFVISLPVFHFLWVIGSFFLVFYAVSTLTNYTAAVVFAVMIAVGVPFWTAMSQPRPMWKILFGFAFRC